MLAEVTLEVTPTEVTPSSGKGALGRWRASHGSHRPDTEPGSGVSFMPLLNKVASFMGAELEV